ncbi:MAG: hypothetical protein J0M18_01390 [Ignavibacteria bacterium]|nr:hypothetical protein [Ignavibacteria bacterium]
MKNLYIYVLLLIFFSGCSIKNDVKLDTDVTPFAQEVKSYNPSDFDALEEVYENLNYDDVVSEYASKLPGDFKVVRFRYFVVFSNLDEKTTYDLIDMDIRNTVDAMLTNYIDVKPDEVTAVFLFKDKESYRDFSINEFAIEEDDLSPYGFFKISRKAIVVRYVNWKGSTSHEVTHAMIQNDFPEIPSWFNEGFASMHEKAIYNNGKLTGSFSWRILALRRAFNENTYVPLKQTMSTNDTELYGKRSSYYYAQSCYALMLLHEKGLFEEFYKSFRDNYSKDRTGIKQLEKLTGMTVDKFDEELVEYIKSFKQEMN